MSNPRVQPNPTQPDPCGLSWVELDLCDGLGWIFFWPTMIGWVKISSQPDPCTPLAARAAQLVIYNMCNKSSVLVWVVGHGYQFIKKKKNGSSRPSCIIDLERKKKKKSEKPIFVLIFSRFPLQFLNFFFPLLLLLILENAFCFCPCYYIRDEKYTYSKQSAL